MNNKQKLHQLHLNEWAARFADQKSSGLTVRQWCEQNNYTIHTYNYWKHRLKDELANQILPEIVPLSIPPLPQPQESTLPTTSIQPHDMNLANCAIRANRSTATLTINGIAIEVTQDISEDFLRTLIKAVRYA